MPVKTWEGHKNLCSAYFVIQFFRDDNFGELFNSNEEGVTIPVKRFDPHLQTQGWNESSVWDSKR